MTEKIIRPDVRALLEGARQRRGPKIHELDPPEARAMLQRLQEQIETPVGALAVLRDLAMVDETGAEIGLRLFDARAERGPGPALIYYHGGGFVVGDLDTHGSLCAEIARQMDLPVIAVDYRLAPEHPWPAAPDDAEAAARWIATSPAALGLDVTGLILAGDSAGGTLAIVSALALRDRPADVPVEALWPIYPAVSPSTRFKSFEAFGDGHALDRDQLAWYFGHYKPDVRHWRATPTRLSQAGLPPTFVLTASLDPLVDQGRAYAEQCRRDGVPVEYLECAGTVHGFLSMRQALPSGEEDLRRATDILKRLTGRAVPAAIAESIA